MSKGYKHAFSLIELMVVIAIVAVLSAIAIPAYNGYIKRAKMQAIYNTIQQQTELWSTTNSTGDWGNWGISDRYRPITDSSLSSIYVNWYGVSLTFNGGYFDREGPTYVLYSPVVDGQVVDQNQSISQLNGANIISWSCDVSGPGSAYPGGLTVVDFQKLYFPNCTCLTC